LLRAGEILCCPGKILPLVKHFPGLDRIRGERRWEQVNSYLRTEQEITALYYRHVDTVWRICYSFLKNRADCEDMVQETFLRLLSCGKQFQSPEHEKAWLIVTASNLCKDQLKRAGRRDEPLDDHTQMAAPPQGSFVLSAVLELPSEYKMVVYLYYYEGYSTKEIAALLHCPHTTVRTRLARARKRLKLILGGELDEK
jgi:RNA polymerase sigma-70 factor (ECF subfamily)